MPSAFRTTALQRHRSLALPRRAATSALQSGLLCPKKLTTPFRPILDWRLIEPCFHGGHNAYMPNIASVLKAEITRLARKENRDESVGLKRAVAVQRKEMASLKARLQVLEKAVQRLGKVPKAPRPEPSVSVASGVTFKGDAAERLRFRAAGMASNRKRLGLSAADFALLVGTTGQSIYAWEAGRSKPRAEALKAIASLRHVGKREVETRLAELKG